MIDFLKKSASQGKRRFAFTFFLIQLSSLTANVAMARPIKIPPPPPPPVEGPIGAIISILQTLIVP